jgi:hypothetical protein
MKIEIKNGCTFNSDVFINGVPYEELSDQKKLVFRNRLMDKIVSDLKTRTEFAPLIEIFLNSTDYSSSGECEQCNDTVFSEFYEL